VLNDSSAQDPTLRGTEDLIISDANGARILYGRPASDWPDSLAANAIYPFERVTTDVAAGQVSPFSGANASVAALGDVGGDAREDFALFKGRGYAISLPHEHHYRDPCWA
jgi:hypothetical protein